jgi:uncharacterized protein YndB with AHSA1/START domain
MITQPIIAPVRESLTVERDLEDAFRIFTAEMTTWWPFEPHSIGGGETERVTLEPRVGGRLYETMRSGAEHEWGRVTAWDPPNRVVFAWYPGDEPERATEVEIRFAAADGNTRVDLEHRGWERLGERAAESRDAYSNGWPRVLGRFVEAAGD